MRLVAPDESGAAIRCNLKIYNRPLSVQIMINHTRNDWHEPFTSIIARNIQKIQTHFSNPEVLQTHWNIWSSPSLISYNVFAVQTLINYKIVNILKISWIHKTRRQTSCACTERFDACHILRRAAKFAASLLLLYTITSIIRDKQSVQYYTLSKVAIYHAKNIS